MKDFYVNENLERWCQYCVRDAIYNIKNRKLKRSTKELGPYDIANWVKDWKWMNDSNSTFDLVCRIAGYDNPDLILNETMRLAKARIEDGVQLEREWILGEIWE